MDDAANRYAQELMEAIAAAMAHNVEVQACRARAKAAGFEIEVAIQAQVQAAGDGPLEALASAAVPPPSRRLLPAARTYEITAADRRFLRSLRIAADATTEAVE